MTAPSDVACNLWENCSSEDEPKGHWQELGLEVKKEVKFNNI